MKKSISTLAFLIFIAGTLMISCKSSTKEETESQEKVQDARENVQDAKDSLVVAKKAATAEEWKAFKNETDSVINDNKARIAELKLKMKKTDESIDAKYQKNIDILEQKNKDLKVKMDTYKNDANSDWQSFKREFNHDMDEIGQAFKDLTVDNKK
ncbi:peptidase M23 [Flavobacterium sp.]|uniref:peptidase M23 n=1 Tax=Flavobacterium sp. TaxID=239 RepID=UPI0037507ED7